MVLVSAGEERKDCVRNRRHKELWRGTERNILQHCHFSTLSTSMGGVLGDFR